MVDWAELTREIESLLRLETYPVAYKKLEKREELDKIPGVRRLKNKANFCQIPTLVRRGGVTIGLTREDLLGVRCALINGLAAPDEAELESDAVLFGTRSWFATVEEARKQMAAFPLIPPGDALVLAPLASGKFEPDVILIYGNPAQLMLLMNGLQFQDYERFQFYFIGDSDYIFTTSFLNR